MNPPSHQAGSPPGESEHGIGYTLEILSEITGISTQTIVHYQEHGLIRPSTGTGSTFDDEAVRALHRIEHLRDACGMNLSGLKLLTSLLDELERLRAELRKLR